MKKIIVTTARTLTTIILALGALPQTTNSADGLGISGQQKGASQALIEQFSSLSRLLYELASERHAAITNRSEVWILTTHRGLTVRKFSDGRYTVVSLPARQEADRIAVCMYASHYNLFVERELDKSVNRANYKAAAEVYLLLRHFEPCGESLTTERLDKKLAILQRLQKREDVANNLKAFHLLCEQVGNLIDLSQIERAPVTAVTNLLEIRLP